MKSTEKIHEEDFQGINTHVHSYQIINDKPRCDIQENTLLEHNDQAITTLNHTTNVKSGRDYPQCTSINTIKTLATYIAYFGAGMGTSILGATILLLQVQTNSSTEQIAPLFTWRGLGCMLGSALCSIVLHRVPAELILLVACLTMTAVVLAIPFCTSLVVLMTLMVINGLIHGVFGGGSTYHVIKIWRLKAPPFIQALHFLLSFGSSISPLVVDIFISDTFEGDGQVNTTMDSNITDKGNKRDFIEEADHFANGSTTELNGLKQLPNMNFSQSNHTTSAYNLELFFPFLIPSIFFICASLLYIWVLCHDFIMLKKNTRKRFHRYHNQEKEKSKPIKHKPIFAILIIYIMIYGGLESTYGGWLLAFCVKYLNFSYQQAAFISVTFWASLAGSRALSICTSKIFSPELISCTCLLIATVALTVEMLACTVHPVVMLVCSIAVGVSFGPMLGQAFAYSQNQLHTSGRAVTVYVMFVYVGFMSMPTLVGFLFANYTPLSFLYVLTAGSACMTIMFFGVVIFLKVNNDN